MIVSIVWWQQGTGVSARGNKECFEEAGCDVEIVDAPTPLADLIFTPIPGVKYDRDVPLLTQLGGFGPNLLLPRSEPHKNVERTFEFSDAVTVLDPNMHIELRRVDIDEETLMVPNAAPFIAMPDAETGDFTVLCPQGDSPMKEPERLAEAVSIVGEREPDIKFVFPSKSGRWRNPLEWLDLDNLRVVPNQSHKNMEKLYAQADVIMPYSSAEILPTTVFEGFISGKPVIVNEIGRIQSVAREHLEKMCSDFGTASGDFHERWKGEYMSGEGEHFFKCKTPREVADAVMDLHGSDILRHRVGLRGQEWVDEYSEHWSQEDRGRKLLEAAGID